MHALRSNLSGIIPDGIKNKLRGILFSESKKPEISPEAREYLKDYYKKDVEAVREITQSDCWAY